MPVVDKRGQELVVVVPVADRQEQGPVDDRLAQQLAVPVIPAVRHVAADTQGRELVQAVVPAVDMRGQELVQVAVPAADKLEQVDTRTLQELVQAVVPAADTRGQELAQAVVLVAVEHTNHSVAAVLRMFVEAVFHTVVALVEAEFHTVAGPEAVFHIAAALVE